jgi:hypothetical protein
VTTLFGTDLIVLLLVAGAGIGACYLLLLNRLKSMMAKQQLKIADQLGALDDAIRALETRLAEHDALGLRDAPKSVEIPSPANEDTSGEEEFGEITPEIQAAIAAATVAALGPDAVVQSVKPALSPWSQQGRVMVQGGHNFRVRR